MFGFGRKRKEEDISEVKEAVSPPRPAPMPEDIGGAIPADVDRLDDEDMAPISRPIHAPERPKFAPLFVKLDRYKLILENLQEVRMLLENMNHVFSVRREIDKVREEVDSMLERHVNDLATVLSAMDKEFIRPQGADMQMKSLKHSAEIENYMVDLQDELGKLQQQLRELKY